MFKISPSTCDFHDREWLVEVLQPHVYENHICNHIASFVKLRYYNSINESKFTIDDYTIECSELCPYYTIQNKYIV